MMELFLSQIHFLRPYWFFSFIPLILLSLLIVRTRTLSKSWQSIIDPKLLPHLLVGKQTQRSRSPGIIYFLVGALIIISLAGPAWEKRPQPVFKERSALVIALDLSRSMDAGDIKPSRLTRAKHKITDILKKRKLGQTALIVYAADAYTVSPLTDDTATITALLSSLTTNLMPSQGTRTDKALQLSTTLLANAGIPHGDILLVTDSIESNASTSFKKTASEHRISILAVATRDGAPIPQQNGGFFKDRSGNIVVAKLNISQFNKIMNNSKGHFTTITSNDTDIETITSLFTNNRSKLNEKTNSTTLQTDSWYEQGPWLLFLVIPLVALAFRKGLLFMLAIILLQQPQQAQADTLWDSLWSNKDQRAATLLEHNKPADAAELFANKQWESAAHYKNKQYQKSIEALQDIDTADAHYNKGNAYAQLGDNKKAIEEYSFALNLDPKHEDALFNKDIIEKKEKEKKQQQQNKDNKQSSESDKDSNKDKKQSDKGQPDKNQTGKNQSDNGKNSQDQNNSNPKESDQNSKDNQNKSEQNSDNKSKSAKKNDNQDSPDKNSKDKQQKSKTDKDSDKESASAKSQIDDAELKQNEKLTKQWLRRIPDDPGGLLRNKFYYQYKRQQHSSEDKNW